MNNFKLEIELHGVGHHIYLLASSEQGRYKESQEDVPSHWSFGCR